VRALREDLAAHRERVSDLELRIRTIRARNRVLINLVQGLTTDPDHKGLSAPESGAKIVRAREALADLDNDLDVLADALKKSRKDFVELHDERERLETSLSQAVRTLEESKKREALAQERVDTFAAMLLKLRSMIAESKLDVQVRRNQMVVKLPDRLMFDTGKAELRPEGKLILDDVAEVLKAVPDREFQVAGHTDDVPIQSWRYPSNWHLSATRAVNVTRYLIERGVPANRISGAAFADTRPLSASSTEEARRVNRRIEIALLPNLAELPDLSVLDRMSSTAAEAVEQPAAASQPALGAPAPAASTPAAPATPAPSAP